MECFAERQDSEPTPHAWALAGSRPSHPCELCQSRARDPAPRTPETLQGPSQLLLPTPAGTSLWGNSWAWGPVRAASALPDLDSRLLWPPPAPAEEAWTRAGLTSSPTAVGWPLSSRFVSTHVGCAKLPFPVVPGHCQCSSLVCQADPNTPSGAPPPKASPKASLAGDTPGPGEAQELSEENAMTPHHLL